MIQARHSAPAEFLFSWYIRRSLKKRFRAVHLFGGIAAETSGLPILLLPNHNSWWDGFFVWLLNAERYKRPVYLMMLEEQLRKYRFFSRIGAYSVDPGNRKSVAESLHYTGRILESAPPPLVRMFPQGKLTPFGTELRFQRGYEWIVRRHEGDIAIVPLGMRIEFLESEYPEAFLMTGEPVTVTQGSCPPSELLEENHAALLERLVRNIRDRAPSSILIEGRRSAHERFDAVFERNGAG